MAALSTARTLLHHALLYACSRHNPIFDIGFGKYGQANFAPAVRLARKIDRDLFFGLEYYADFGEIGHFGRLPDQQHSLFAVTDFKFGVFDVNLGLGYGLTHSSDRFVVKTIVGYAFPTLGGSPDARLILFLPPGSTPRSTPQELLPNAGDAPTHRAAVIPLAPASSRSTDFQRYVNLDAYAFWLLSRNASLSVMPAVPSMNQAGSYSGTLAHLAAVARTGRADDGAAVVSAMRAAGVFDDPLFGKTSVRADGRVIRDMYLFEVKKPSESTKPYDYYKVVSVIPGDKAFRPLSEGA